MSSFSAEVKNELARVVANDTCCRFAELVALLRMGASVSIGSRMNLGINFSTENAAIARKMLTLIKDNFKLKTEVVVSRARRLKKNNSYLIRVVPAPAVGELLHTLGIMQGENLNVSSDERMLQKTCCRQAYLRGAFLGGGSVSKPEGDYHLELVTGNINFANTLSNIFKKFQMPVGLTDRKNDYIVYLKDSEAIVDFLGLVGAEEAIVEFEVARNVKDVRNQVNRLVNCETANLQKTVNAAVRQLERIKIIEQKIGLGRLPANLKEIALLRLAHPEANLQELVEANDHKIGKSGMNHRLRKLEQIAVELIEGEEE
ncbi:DNA-binding protein WhiA [Anaerosinus massiliensis]|uniref:DNA-binding protein WhiA n=1 Tax=Massilibacillus massiliensis TaxID=1806837 RepID=UPI000B24AAFE|nr:DNA-binding protein WhiA [Massilibacillus massiliensis]